MGRGVRKAIINGDQGERHNCGDGAQWLNSYIRMSFAVV